MHCRMRLLKLGPAQVFWSTLQLETWTSKSIEFDFALICWQRLQSCGKKMTFGKKKKDGSTFYFCSLNFPVTQFFPRSIFGLTVNRNSRRISRLCGGCFSEELQTVNRHLTVLSVNDTVVSWFGNAASLTETLMWFSRVLLERSGDRRSRQKWFRNGPERRWEFCFSAHSAKTEGDVSAQLTHFTPFLTCLVSSIR